MKKSCTTHIDYARSAETIPVQAAEKFDHTFVVTVAVAVASDEMTVGRPLAPQLRLPCTGRVEGLLRL